MNIDGALEKTYREHINLFLSIGRYNYGLSPETGMDRLQEAFVKIWSNRHRIKNHHEAGVRNYALKVFRNTCIDHLRKNKGPTPLQPDNCHRINRTTASPIETVADLNADPLNEILLIEEMRMQSAALDKVPPKYRETVRLSLQGLKPREVSRQLGIKSTTIKNLKHRGLKMFQNELRKIDPERMPKWMTI